MPDSFDSPTLESIGGFRFSRRSDGIFVFRFTDSRRETADAWSRILPGLEHAAERNGEHIRCLYFMKGIWITPYIIQTAVRTARLGSDRIKSSSAIVVADRFGSGLMQTILRQLPAQAMQARQIFTNEDEAIKWLDERLALLENIPLPP